VTVRHQEQIFSLISKLLENLFELILGQNVFLGIFENGREVSAIWATLEYIIVIEMLKLSIDTFKYILY
jgi:hypothetical protein